MYCFSVPTVGIVDISREVQARRAARARLPPAQVQTVRTAGSVLSGIYDSAYRQPPGLGPLVGGKLNFILVTRQTVQTCFSIE